MSNFIGSMSLVIFYEKRTLFVLSVLLRVPKSPLEYIFPLLYSERFNSNFYGLEFTYPRSGYAVPIFSTKLLKML